MIQNTDERGGMGTDHEASALGSVDGRMICLMRLILALSALLIIYIDPSEPDRLVEVTYAALVTYSLYSALLYFFSARDVRLLPEGFTHWGDVGCYLLLIALSSGTSSIFFFFFFFAILVASFRWGFRAGLNVTLASALLFTVVGYETAPSGHGFELNRFLLRPIYLLVLGYMMAYWGGREMRLKRRLNLLREVSGLSNPRFGVGHTLAALLRRLRAFYGSERALLILSDPRGGRHSLLSIGGGGDEAAPRPRAIPEPLARTLLSLPGGLAVRYCAGRGRAPFRRPGYYAYDASAQGTRTAEGLKESGALAAWFEADSFVSVPLRLQQKDVGRLYLTGGRGLFDDSDVEFLQQVIEQVGPSLDNIELLERLASSAAERERERLARDIHDSVIQPYIGLQYRLAAVCNKADAGADVAADLRRLLQSTQEEVGGLRGFVRGLKDGGGARADELAPAVRRFAAQFGESYGISVGVEIRGEPNVDERLAAELIRFVHEGLSNVRKHTDATRSTVTLECGGASCVLRIENDGADVDGEGPAAFTPRSITERAEELGGHARAERDGSGHTVVTIEIPL